MAISVELEEELFAAASALPLQERGRYLQRACGRNQQLRDRLESLLAAATPAARLLNLQQWGQVAPPLTAAQSADCEIGPYQLLYEIGEGGCGVVFLAEQVVPVRRQVALKIIKLGMDTKAVIARFNAERQALALMDHPNIAKVLDAGATPTGRPYFAMELVQGVKITTYCDQARLSTAERLALFVQICHAIQHAHHQGVVHRDIKPSNVLVTLHDGIPMVKVIDFGIAKATQGRLTNQTLYTALDQFMGTPAYMSPEQTDFGSGDVDARSDIYSMGVLLYELLTGCTPFDGPESSTGGLGTLLRRIRREEPLTPSKRLHILSREPLTEVAERRQTTPAKLVELVQGDLDWIVTRCLEKDRLRRYASAEVLAADVQRFLNHEPVTARPPGVLYSLRKFAKRHRLAFTAGTTIVVVLMAATAVSTWLAVRASRAENLAQIAAATQREVINFLQNDLLAQASPDQEPDRDLKLRTVLDRAASKIAGRFVDQPLVEAAIRNTLAETYLSLGEANIAQTHLQRARELYRRELGETHASTLKVARTIVHTLIDQGQYQQAEQLGRKTLAVHRRVFGDEHPDTLDATSTLATSLYYQGNAADAAQLLARTLESRRRVLGLDHRDTLVTMNDLGVFYMSSGQLAKAEPLMRQALELDRRVLGTEHPETLIAMNTLAMLYGEMGKEHESELLLAQTLQLRERRLGADHPLTLNAMNNLALSYFKQGAFAAAEQLQVRTAEILRNKLGAEHPSTLSAMNNLAMTYVSERKLSAAQELLSSALEMQTRRLGADHLETLISMSNLAVVRHRQGLLIEAEEMQSRALQAAKRALGSENADTLLFADHLAEVQLDRKKYSEAEALLRPNAATRQRLFPGQWRTFATQSRLGQALLGLNRYAEAEPLLIAAYQGLKERAQRIPAYQGSIVQETANRIPELYSAWNKPDKRTQWERELGGKQLASKSSSR